MRTRLLMVAMLATLAPPAAAQDLFLARLTDDRGSPAVDGVRRLTNRPGYDSQPSFTDSNTILYTVMAGDNTDIWRYDVARGTTAAVTTTSPESEYSARTMPDGQRISVVMVERDSTQRIWSFAPNGGDPRVVLEHVKGVGYYTWLDAEHIVAFVIGNPDMLELVDVRTGTRQSIAGDVGRTIQKVPGRNAISFVQLAAEQSWICIYDVDTKTMELLVKTPAQNEFYTWTPAGALISGEGSKLYVWDGVARGGWKTIADLASAGVNGISRFAVSADGKLLVIVAAD